jgi:hypothetical protein
MDIDMVYLKDWSSNTYNYSWDDGLTDEDNLYELFRVIENMGYDYGLSDGKFGYDL